MEFKVSCKDIGGFEDCTFVAEGATLREIEEELMEHGMTHHGDVIQALTEAEREAMMRKIADKIAEQQARQ
jgi:predicted small metal-binding protein